MDATRRIADAVLYEGYVLSPYRKSAMKNQRRWTFGGVYPPAHTADHPDDRSGMRAEFLLEAGDDTRLEVFVRFLHVVRRQVFERTQAGPRPVESLQLDAERLISWDEATEREIGSPALANRSTRIAIQIPAGSAREAYRGALVERSWRALAGMIEITADPAGDGVERLAVVVRNETPWDGADREDALRSTFCSTHAVVRVEGGAFVSLTDPPPQHAAQAAGCRNEGCWPVLVGDEGDRSTLLCSPIILSDHPQIAPESPGDLFDGGEIDQLLILNILSLTDEEKREMRDSDPRAREILERTERLSHAELMRLHGTIREFGMARR